MVLIGFLLSSLKFCPNYIGVGYLIFVLRSKLSRVESLDKLYIFKSNFTTSIYILLSLLISLGGAINLYKRHF